MDVNVLWLACAGIAVGFVQGLLGSGGFLLTPILIMMGVSPAVAAASGVNAIAGASVSGTFAHLKAGTVDVHMGVLMLVGGILGGALGTDVVRMLRAVGNLDSRDSRLLRGLHGRHRRHGLRGGAGQPRAGGVAGPR